MLAVGLLFASALTAIMTVDPVDFIDGMVVDLAARLSSFL